MRLTCGLITVEATPGKEPGNKLTDPLTHSCSVDYQFAPANKSYNVTPLSLAMVGQTDPLLSGDVNRPGRRAILQTCVICTSFKHNDNCTATVSHAPGRSTPTHLGRR